ncbi:MAG: WGR domain-containing protein [bacterium]
MNCEMFYIELRACDPDKNISRFYVINVGRDLLGDLIVTLRNGRIGHFGRLKYHVCKDLEEAAKIVRKSLKRRNSSPKRIGVAYEIKTISDPFNWLES